MPGEQSKQTVSAVALQAVDWNVPGAQAAQAVQTPPSRKLPARQLVHLVAEPLHVAQLESHPLQTRSAAAEQAALW